MKKMITALTLSLSATLAMAQAKYEPGQYNIDPAHSKVGFEIPHLVISTVEGSFSDFSGKIELNKDFTKSKVSAAVKIASVDTGNEKRDAHLKSDDFFGAAKFPEMTFVSQSLSGKPAQFKMTGDLTIKGVTKKVTFDSKYMGSVKDGYGQQKAVINAKTKVNRKDFGLTWSSMVEAGPVVGDEVTIELKIQAAQEKQEQAKK